MDDRNHTVKILGLPFDAGASQRGCVMGPDALRTAGLVRSLKKLGWSVEDVGNRRFAPLQGLRCSNKRIRRLPSVAGLLAGLEPLACDLLREGHFPLFLGGDHSLSLGSVAGLARAAAEMKRPLFVLWLDAHPDFHSLETSQSGFLHGTPTAYFTGQPGFEALPKPAAAVETANLCMMGLRSVDRAEAERLRKLGTELYDMSSIDEMGVLPPLLKFLERVRKANGYLHVSLDVDFLDPLVAPAVGTTVPGGITFREAHLIMEKLHESGLVTSLDLAELNPILDERGRTTRLLVDLTASLFGKTILDRKTRGF